MEKFLKDPVNEIKIGALKNLHIFLAELHPETREKFIDYIVKARDNAAADWRTRLVLAQNLGKYA